MLRSGFSALVAGITTLTLVLGPAATSMQVASAEPRVEDMGTVERVASIAGGATLITGAVLTSSIGGYVLTGAVYTAVGAVVGVAAAPAVVTGLLVVALGVGTYFLVKGIIGKKTVDGPAPTSGGLNAGRNERTTPIAPSGAPVGSPNRVGVGSGGRTAAGTPR